MVEVAQSPRVLFPSAFRQGNAKCLFPPSLLPVKNFKALPGSGTQGVVDGSLMFLTNLNWLTKRGPVAANVEAAFEAAHAKGETAVALSDMFGVVAVFAVADTLKANAAQAVALMKKAELTPWLLTGDNKRAAAAIAERMEYTANENADDDPFAAG